MSNSLLQCPRCRAWLVEGVFDPETPAPCPACGVPLMVEVYPAFFRERQTAPAGEAVMMEGESGCFFHPEKKAVIPCEGCGRFLCALCDCELSGHHYCPACLEAGAAKKKIAALETDRTRYDGIAMSVTLGVLVCPPVCLVTTPYVLYLVVRHWNAPRSLVGGGRGWLVTAAVIAILELAGLVVLVLSGALNNSHG